VPPNVVLVPQSSVTVWIVIKGYSTFAAAKGQFCACGLNQVGAITGFQAAMVVDPQTNKPVAGWNFAPNDEVGKQFDDAAPTIGTVKVTRAGQVVPSVPQAPFGGFLSPISANVPAGLTVDLWICVTIRTGTTVGQLAQALSAQGQIGTSASDANGVLQSGHTNIVRPGTITEMKLSSNSVDSKELPSFFFDQQ
jgi:hypothetical protein